MRLIYQTRNKQKLSTTARRFRMVFAQSYIMPTQTHGVIIIIIQDPGVLTKKKMICKYMFIKI